MIGQTLSHFKITAKLGEGGMGEVYRAEDSKLGRDVAIKVLPEAMAEDPERLARFEREAKVLASLNHQNIAGIHEVGRAQDEVREIHFLVMELAEGEDLAARLERGGMPVNEALGVGLQIALALEAAHAKEIIHRDLKPANVKISASAEVKVLDFGLAKALDPEATVPGTERGQSMSPTLTANLTQAGTLLGTAAYMSPEQARGQEVDKRTDIWSFGVMLFEMLSGQRMFAGDTVSDSLAAILRADPEWVALPDSTPRAARRLLRRCLERDPERRLHDIADARIEIEDALTGEEESLLSEADTAPPPRPFWRAALPWAVAAASALLAGWIALQWQVPAAEPPLRKLEIAEIEETNTLALFLRAGAISPDGLWVAYVSEGSLWLRRLSEFEPRQIPGSNFESVPVWSPDSRWLAYPAGRTLWKTPVVGGEPKAIGNLPTNVGPFGGTWGENGRIVLTTGYSGLLEVSAQGGDFKEVLAPDPETEVDFHHASLLPGGRGVVFSIHYKDRPEGSLAVWDGKSRQVILEIKGLSLEAPIYSPSGHILFVRRPTSYGIWAVPFSIERLEVTGEPFLLVLDAHSPSVAVDGSLVFVDAVGEEMRQLTWLDRSGQELGPAGLAQPGIRHPALALAEDRVVVSALQGRSWDVWIQDLQAGTKNQLTFSPNEIQGPRFSPDGQRVAYFSMSNEPHMFVVDVEGRSEPISIGPGGRPAWSAEGDRLVYELFGARGLWYVELGDDGVSGEPQLILDPPGDESQPTLSPDGQLLAYEADESGHFEIYLTRFPSGEGKWQVSSQGGKVARWSPSGDELFFVDGESNLLGVKVESGSKPRIAAPVLLFSGRSYGLGSDREYGVAKGGTRFLVSRSVSENREKPKLLLVENWFSEFRAVP